MFANEKTLLPKEENLFDKYSNTIQTPPTNGSSDFYMDLMPSTDSETENDDGSLSGASDDDTNPPAAQKNSFDKGRVSRVTNGQSNPAEDVEAGATGKASNAQRRSQSKVRLQNVVD